MQMTLTNFEGIVEQKIVERGYDYYERGRVAKVEKIGKSEFNAVAFGTYDYDVYVKLDGEKIVEYYCDCPYDWGNTCKHEVAVFYKIRYGNFVDTQNKLSEILNNLDDDILRKFVSKTLKKDRKFRRHFLREFDENFVEEMDDYNGELSRFDKHNY